MLLNDMNLRIGKIIRYNNKILIASSNFNIGTNVKISLDGEKDRPDVRSKKVEMVKTKPNIETNKDIKPNIEFDKESKPEPDTNKITYEEEKVALVLGITSIFTVWWMFSLSLS